MPSRKGAKSGGHGERGCCSLEAETQAGEWASAIHVTAPTRPPAGGCRGTEWPCRGASPGLGADAGAGGQDGGSGEAAIRQDAQKPP